MKERLEILPSLSISQSFYVKVVRAFKKGLSITKVHETIGKKQNYSKSNIVSIRNYAIKNGEIERDPSVIASWETKRKRNKQMSLFTKSALVPKTEVPETIAQIAQIAQEVVTPTETVNTNTPLENLQVEETTDIREDELKGVFLSTAEYNTKRRSETANILTIDFKGILVQIENSSNIIVTEDRITVK